MPEIVPEYLRVRKYLYDLVYRNDGRDLRIPPENELARLFGVSRVTVRSAIRGLVDDSILISRRGLGTFINPDAIRQDCRRLPVIGILFGDGRQTYLPSDQQIYAAVQNSGMLAEALHTPDSGAPERLVEIIRDNIAAVIWHLPSRKMEPFFRAIRAAGKPLLIYGNGFENEFDTIRNACAERGVLLAEHLARLGHRHLLYIHNALSSEIDPPESPETTSGSFARRIRKLTGVKFDGYLSLNELDERLSRRGLGKYTVLYSSATLVRPILEILEREHIRIPEHLSFLTAWKPLSFFFQGRASAYLDCDCNLPELVAEWIQRKVLNGEKEIFLRTPESILHEGETLIPNTKP